MRKNVFQLLNEYSAKEKVPMVKIVGSCSDSILYTGSMDRVPFLLCCDYVLRHESAEGELTIMSTYLPS